MYFGKIVNAHIRHAAKAAIIERTKSTCGTRSSNFIAREDSTKKGRMIGEYIVSVTIVSIE